MKAPVLILLTAALCSLHAAEPKPAAPATANRTAPGSFKNVSVDEFEKLRSDKANVVLDVRTPKEFAAGHVPGATNIDINAPDFEKKVAALDPKKTYLVHCAAGSRSARACDKLGRLNFDHLYNLKEGFNGWQKAGLKPEK